MYRKPAILGRISVNKWKKLQTKKHRQWFVRYTVLDPFLWISGLLNDVFVSGLPAIARLPVLLQWSRSLHCVHASVCQIRAFGRCFVFAKSFLITRSVFFCSLSSNILSLSTESCIFGLVHVLNKSLVSIVKWHVTLSVCLLHWTLTLETKILCFCLQKSYMYLVLNII